MIESARVKDRYADMAEGDFVTVNMELEDAKTPRENGQREGEQEAGLPVSGSAATVESAGSEPRDTGDAEPELGGADEGARQDGPEREVNAKAQRLAKLREIKARKAVQEGSEGGAAAEEESPQTHVA